MSFHYFRSDAIPFRNIKRWRAKSNFFDKTAWDLQIFFLDEDFIRIEKLSDSEMKDFESSYRNWDMYKNDIVTINQL